MELIRPLYCVHEEDIIAWKNYNGLRFLQCACRFTEERDAAEDGVGQSKRQEMKQLMQQGREVRPLFYDKDKPLMRTLRMEKNLLGHFKKFKQYYERKA